MADEAQFAALVAEAASVAGADTAAADSAADEAARKQRRRARKAAAAAAAAAAELAGDADANAAPSSSSFLASPSGHYRSFSASAGPSTALSPSSSSTAALGPGDRLAAWGERNHKRREEDRRRALEQREREATCTFKPDLSATQGFRKHRPPESAALLERLGEWERRRQERQAGAQYEALLSEAAELTFSPQISQWARDSEGGLPEDVKQALRSPEAGAASGTVSAQAGAASAARRESQLQAFLHRQSRARVERALKIEQSSPRSSSSPSAGFTGRTTVPVEPLLNTARRASTQALAQAQGHSYGHGAGAMPALSPPPPPLLLASPAGATARARLQQQLSRLGAASSPSTVAAAAAPSALPNALVVSGGSLSASATWVGDRGGVESLPAATAVTLGSSSAAPVWSRYAPDVAALLASATPAPPAPAPAIAPALTSSTGGGGGSSRSAARLGFGQAAGNSEELLAQLSVRDLYDAGLNGVLRAATSR